MYLRRRVLLTSLALGLVLLTMLVAFTAVPAHALSSTPSQNGVTVIVQSTPDYDVTGSNTASINATIRETSLTLGAAEVLTIETDFALAPPNGTAIENGVPVQLQGIPVVSSSGTYSVTIPANTTSFEIWVPGSESGATFLWRYIISVPGILVTLSGNSLPTTTYFEVPSGTVVSQVYTYAGGTLPLGDAYQSSSASGQVTYAIVGGAGLLIFQSSAFLPASVAITVCALALVGLAALNLFAAGRQLFDNTLAEVSEQFNKLRGWLRLSGTRRGFSFRKLLQPRKLLILFILCAVVMVAVGALGGPDPQVKAYVIANQGDVASIQSQLQQVAPNVQVVTPSEDYSDFAVMSSVNDFNLVVISSYPAAQWDNVAPFVLPSLTNVPVVVMYNSTSAAFQTQVNDTYPASQIVFVSTTNMTSSDLTQLAIQLSSSARTNVIGLNVSPTDFKLILAFEAILSMVLVFLGWAYLGSLTSESRTMSDLSHLVVVIAAGVFVFFFSESLYVATSSILAFPLSLHAVNTGARITAISLLGFGGGTTPRLVAGFLGVVVGAVAAERGPTFKKTDFALVAGIALILLANPLYLGKLVFQGILLFYPIGSLAFGEAYSSSLTVKGFLYGFGLALAGGGNATYVLSAGKILYFAGLVPLAYLKKMGRTTSVIALLFAALIIGDGGVRVGEMTPDKSEIAVLPGLVVGFAFAALMLALAVIEKYVRGNWRSRA